MNASTTPAAVATPHPEAARAARDVLDRGGNAVDAAVAAMLALCVVTPNMVGLGGYGGSMIVYGRTTRKAIAIDFDSRAPLAYRDELFADPASRNTGYRSVSVPGVVAGLDLARREFGTRSWGELSAHAIDLAERGFPIDAELKRRADTFLAGTDPASRAAQFPTGAAPAAGETFAQPDLARVLRRLADDGPESFYDGDIPRAIVAQVCANGGILSEEDFARYRATLAEPVSVDYRGHAVLTPPPPSGGITSLAILKTLEQFELAALDPRGGTQASAGYYHLFIEAAKRCFHERQQHLGDPDLVSIPLEKLLSAGSAARRAAEIRNGNLARNHEPPDAGPHTANVCVVDREGNAVSVTATQGYQFGSLVCIGGLGLVLGHGMSRFDYVAGHPNAPAPLKRMMHNMSPMLLMKGDDLFAALGMPGGPKIVTVTAQLAAGLIDFGMSAQDAATAGRVHTEGDEPIGISSAVPESVAAALRAHGHTTRLGQDVGGPPGEIGGPANIISRDARTGGLEAASGAGADCAGVL